MKSTIRLALALTLALLVFGGLGVQGAMAAEGTDQADISVVVRPREASNNMIVYEIVAANHGGLPANATILVPFDPASLKLLDVSFSDEGAWVSNLQPNQIELQTGKIGQGTLTATVRFHALKNISVGSVLGDRLTFGWSERQGASDAERSGRSNLPILAAANQQFYTLATTPISGPSGTRYTFSSDIFAPGESVTLWFNTPDGKVVPVQVNDGVTAEPASSAKHNENSGDENHKDAVNADGDGKISLDFISRGLTPGSYTMVARGNLTGFTAVGIFQVR